MDGILPVSRAGFMLDFITLAMVGLGPLIYFGVRVVRVDKNYSLHKTIFLCVTAVLAVAVTAFEFDIRVNGWRHMAEPSPYYDTLVFPALWIHLFFAIATALLWVATIIKAHQNIPKPPRPSETSARHARVARWAVRFMYGTCVTGWLFYYLAFIA